MVSGSSMEALRKRITQMKELFGEWASEDDTVALWVEHIMGENLSVEEFLETHDWLFKEKVISLKVDIKSLMDDFKSTLLSFDEDFVVLKNVL